MENKTELNEIVSQVESPKAPEKQVDFQKQKTGVSKMIIALLFVIIVILGVTVFFLVREKSVTSNQEVTSQLTNSSLTLSRPDVDKTSWLTFSDPKVGFSFMYPNDIVINSDLVSGEAGDDSQMIINVSVEKLTDIPEDMPLRMGRVDAIEEKERLSKGEGNVVKLGSLNGYVTPSYSQFEVCSVFFSRKLTFYPGEYRVIIHLNGPKEKIMAEMPDFFIVDTKNCGENLMWNRDYKIDFETTLREQKGLGVGQEWYNNFYNILDTFVITTPVITSPTSTPKVEGITYTNEKYGFQLVYDSPYKVLVDKDNLYGYPNGVILLYKGGQAYDIVVEHWDTVAAYENEYSGRMNDITVFKYMDKFITFLNNTNSAENKKIIESVVLLP